ncbi:thermonuclease family protein [Nesterenkonia xinjiangensis]|uniref:Micrococcal nuclease n=1 Tax=Nesterenkonia xinjiangensis TaxID=225327 RepID=A0A7Z0GMI5_9MICC|nr:thermonuclease family protein [Nesterenkonia xinjiangensis]NYJ78716.1 micrococcal nuclease [Nesterenkonia xinjiangensis]
MPDRYLKNAMRRNARKTVRRSLRTAPRGGRRGGGSQGLLWWLLAVLGVILIGAVISWLQGLGAEEPQERPEGAEAGTLVRVIDGDTLIVELDGQDERIRLLNIDTPESVHPTEPVECLGPESSAHMETLVSPGDEVFLEYDQERTDRYDRMLAGVWADEVLLNVQMARAGYGAPVHYPPNDRFLAAVEQAWEQAEADGVGLFAADLDCEPALP